MKEFLFITGAQGFLGRWCADYFSASGFNVVGIGHSPSPGSKNFSPCSGLYAFINDTVTTDVLDAAAEMYGLPQAIIHCAGGSSVGTSYEQPREDFLRTVQSTIEVLEFSRRQASAIRVVYPSSAAVYGTAGKLPMVEDAQIAPVSPYGKYKYIAEQACRLYAEERGIPVAIIRFFSLYGEGLRKQLLWDACCKVLRGEFSFSGDGSEVRDWLSVHDAVRLIAIALDRASPDCPVVNGGTGCGMTVKAMLITLGHLFNPDLLPVFSGKARTGDPEHQIADTSHLREWGFTPSVDRQAGISAYVKWFRENFEGPKTCTV